MRKLLVQGAPAPIVLQVKKFKLNLWVSELLETSRDEPMELGEVWMMRHWLSSSR